MRHARPAAWSALALAAALAAPALGAEPIRLHPDNPHYFLFRGAPAVLVTSGEHYGAVLNLDFDYVTYLNTLQAKGLNLTRTFSGMYVETWGSPWNTLNPPTNRYVAPWARSATPGYADGGNKFDLSQWDPAYFSRLKDFVAQAGQRGIVVELVLFCVFYDDGNWGLSPLNAANNVNGVGTNGRWNVYNETDPAMMAAQAAMVQKIVAELRDCDNVYFELCNEPYFDGPAYDSTTGRAWNDRIIGAIRGVSTAHLVSQNIANGSTTANQPHANVSILNFHYSSPPDSVAQNYAHNRAIAFDESGFRGSADAAYRKEAWDFLVAGGAVYDNLDWSYTDTAENGTSTAWDKGLGGGGPTIQAQLGILRGFLSGFNLVPMGPGNNVILGGLPSGVPARALVETGKQYAIYLNGGSQASLVVDLPAAAYRADWVNTKTGATDRTESFDHAGGGRTLVSPAYSEDIALRIVWTGGGTPPAALPAPPAGATFYRAINLNGGALTIDGNAWEGKGAANVSCTGSAFENQAVALSPATDASRATMIRSSVWNPAGSNVTVSAVPSGTYHVYLYVWEDNNSVTYSVSLEGKVVQSNYSSGGAGHWDRLGPWTADITDGTVSVACGAGDANLSGIEIWKAAAAPPPQPPAASDLRTGPNGHYLVKADGTPFFLLSDTEWLLNSHSDAQVLQILDDRKAKGFTAVQVFATRNWSQTDVNGSTPFVNNDPTQLNAAYWDRWRWIVDRAAERGLHVVLVYGEPGRLENPWKCATTAACYEYGRRVGGTFRDKATVVFCNGQDSDANGGVGAAGWRAMAEGVADGVNGVSAFDGSADYSTTLMTYHGYSIYETFQKDAWIDFYGQEVWHNNAAVYDTVNRGYNLTDPVKPIVFLEGSYEDEQAFITPWYVRVEAWHAVFAGSAGYGYGHYNNWSQTASVDYLGDTAAGQMGVLAAFFAARPWWTMAPDPGAVASDAGTGSSRKVALTAADGTRCWVYYPVNASAGIRMDRITAAATVAASWLDPRNGSTQAAGTFDRGQVATLQPPAGWEDAVLVLGPGSGTLPLRDPEDPASTAPGLDYAYYHGAWPALPDFAALTPVQTGTVANVSLAPRTQDTSFGFVFTGYVRAPADGLYTFSTTSDDGSRLALGTTVVVDNDGAHAMQERSGSIGLKSGLHAIRVEFQQGAGGLGLEVRWTGPGIDRQLIPDGSLVRAVAAPPPPAGAFVTGVNLNGPAVTVDGHPWLSYDAARAAGFSTDAPSAWSGTYAFALNPAPDDATRTVLQSALYRSAPPDGQGFAMSQPVAAGTYDVYLWMIENHQSGFRDIDVRIEGQVVATGLGDLPLGDWRRYGPFRAAVSDGALTVELLRRTKGDPAAYGLAVFAADAALPPVAVPSISPGGGAFTGPVTVSLATATSGASIRYTTDGSTPTSTSGTLYGGPFTLAASATVKAVATRTGMADSPVSSAAFTVTTTPPVPPPGGGTGLLAELFDNRDFSGLKVRRVDATVDFDWGNGSPDAAIGADTFSVRWSGAVIPRYSETTTFHVRTDDGVRLWVDGKLLVDKWVDQGPTEWSGTAALTAGKPVDLRMEYYENGGGAVAQLSWSSASLAKEIVPQDRLTPWAGRDIGAVGQPGSDAYANGTFTVRGSGADIWNAVDAFHYVYQVLTGDGQITARVASLESTDPWAKGGVMMRESLDPGSMHAFMAVTPGNGLAFQRRTTAGGASTHTPGGAGTAPAWVRLVRQGDAFSGYRSADGLAWTWVGTVSIPTGTTIHVGLAVTAHNNAALCAAQIDNVSITTPAAAPTPQVQIVRVSTGKPYSLATSGAGALPYIDRSYTITGLGAALAGGVLVRTSNDDKYATAADHLSLRFSVPAAVYVCYDKRGTLPAFLADGSWTLTGETMASTDGAASPMRVLLKTVQAGDLVLGGNLQAPAAGAQAAYVVIAQAAGLSKPADAVGALAAAAASLTYLEGPIPPGRWMHESDGDADGDGFNDPDTDGDGLWDAFEGEYAVDRSSPDTDGDGVPDESVTVPDGRTLWEVQTGLPAGGGSAPGGGGDGDDGSRCGSIGLDLMAPLALLWLARRRRERKQH